MTNQKNIKSVDSLSTPPDKKKKCPFISTPGKGCYCLDMNSNKISMVLHYCQNHYTECEIYERMKTKKSSNKDLKI